MLITLTIFGIIFLMCLFPNPLWFSISLVILTVVVLCSISALTLVSSLTSFILILVYLGAMLIVISYICAIVPNPLFFNPYGNAVVLTLLPSITLTALCCNYVGEPLLQSTSFNTLAVLFSSECLFLFVLVVLILFFVLLIVTTQFLAPNGPFRSVEF